MINYEKLANKFDAMMKKDALELTDEYLCGIYAPLMECEEVYEAIDSRSNKEAIIEDYNFGKKKLNFKNVSDECVNMAFEAIVMINAQSFLARQYGSDVLRFFMIDQPGRDYLSHFCMTLNVSLIATATEKTPVGEFFIANEFVKRVFDGQGKFRGVVEGVIASVIEDIDNMDIERLNFYQIAALDAYSELERIEAA